MDEGDGLENRYTGNCIVGSNPTPSAKLNFILPATGLYLKSLLETVIVREPKNLYARGKRFFVVPISSGLLRMTVLRQGPATANGG